MKGNLNNRTLSLIVGVAVALVIAAAFWHSLPAWTPAVKATSDNEMPSFLQYLVERGLTLAHFLP